MALELFLGCVDPLDVSRQRLAPRENLPALVTLVLLGPQLMQHVQMAFQRLLALERGPADRTQAGTARRRRDLDLSLLPRFGIHLDLDPLPNGLGTGTRLGFAAFGSAGTGGTAAAAGTAVAVGFRVLIVNAAALAVVLTGFNFDLRRKREGLVLILIFLVGGRGFKLGKRGGEI